MVKLGMFISDRYEIIEKVGSGGMADVYKAKCHRLNRFVAIKVLKGEYSSDTKFVSKFRAEAQSVAGLSHPNIVSVYDVGEDEGLHYIVMELVEGITLKNYIERKGKLETKEALGIAVQIAQGMEAAHKHKIIHRDIKPQNIIISKEGKVKVMDFGIAKAASSNTITSNAMGSVHYISPEQARGGYSDEKSDIYSLGVTLYEMLNGSVPFSGENTVAVALAHIQEEMVPLSILDPGVPKGVDKIVQKCMQKKTEQRYLSASALIADLKRAISDPDGDFVNINPIMDSNSPTIHLPTEEVRNGKSKMIKDAVGKNQAIGLEEEEGVKEKESEIDPKLEKALVIGSIAVAAIICIIIFVIIGNILGLWGKSKGDDKEPAVTETPSVSVTPAPTDQTVKDEDEVEVPDLANYTKEEAIEKLEGLNVEYEVVEEESDLYEEGRVIRTEPDAAEEVKEGDKVTLYVSSGKKKVTVPNVSNKSKENAMSDLLKLKLMIGPQETSYHDTIPAGNVIYTRPAIGTEVKEGELITIVVSKGKETKTVKVPKLIGKSKTDAKELLESKGLKPGVIDNKYSSKYAAGTVCAQSINKNEEVEKGTAINYTVSLGPKPTATPAPSYDYIGSVTVANPFSAENEPAVSFKFVLEQDGKTKDLKDEMMNYFSFPLTIDIKGFSENPGKVKVYKAGALFDTIEVQFQKVAQE